MLRFLFLLILASFEGIGSIVMSSFYSLNIMAHSSLITQTAQISTHFVQQKKVVRVSVIATHFHPHTHGFPSQKNPPERGLHRKFPRNSLRLVATSLPPLSLFSSATTQYTPASSSMLEAVSQVATIRTVLTGGGRGEGGFKGLVACTGFGCCVE